MKNCKALTYRLVLAVCLFVISPLTMSAISMSAIAHEIRPAVADLSMTSAPPSADDQALPGRLSITIDLNAELFLAGLDASLVRDTDDAPQGKDYDALRALTADQLAQKFTDQWPDFEKALTGLADDRPLSFQLDAIEVEDNPAVTLPRSSKIQISAPLEPMMPAFALAGTPPLGHWSFASKARPKSRKISIPPILSRVRSALQSKDRASPPSRF